MRILCEKCEKMLKNDSIAYVCSYECTFCEDCADELKQVCPNCSGELVKRARRKKQNGVFEFEQVKQAGFNDLEDLAKLFNEYRVFYGKTPDIEAAYTFLKHRINRGESLIFVAYDQQSMVGFMQLYPVFSSTRMKPMWLLNDLFVSKNYRQAGYASQLIRAAQTYCKQNNQCGLLLETAINNIEANPLYLKHGFELQNEQNFYFWENK